MEKKTQGIDEPKRKRRGLRLSTRLSVVLMFFCLQIQANGFSQHTRVSLNLGKVSVKQLFLEIEKVTDLAFVYNTNDIDRLEKVDVYFTNEEVETILDYCLKGKGLSYDIVDRHVVVKREEAVAPQTQAKHYGQGHRQGER